MRSQARASSPHPPTPTPRRRRPLTPQLIWKDTSCVGVLPDELLRSPGVPCSSGRAVVGTTPGVMRVRTAPASRAHTHHALRRADTFLVRQSRLAPRSYHRLLEPLLRRYYHRLLAERHAGGAARPLLFGQSGSRHYSGHDACAHSSCVARAHTSRPTQSRHISCAAKPLSAEKLPPTACGTRAHQEGKTSPCTQAGLCYRTALLMCMGMFPLVGRACVGVCVGAGVLCDHSGATRQASDAASPAPTQTPTP